MEGSELSGLCTFFSGSEDFYSFILHLLRFCILSFFKSILMLKIWKNRDKVKKTNTALVNILVCFLCLFPEMCPWAFSCINYLMASFSGTIYLSVTIPLSYWNSAWSPWRCVFPICHSRRVLSGDGGTCCEGSGMSSLNTQLRLPLTCSISTEQEALPLQKRSPPQIPWTWAQLWRSHRSPGELIKCRF